MSFFHNICFTEDGVVAVMLDSDTLEQNMHQKMREWEERRQNLEEKRQQVRTSKEKTRKIQTFGENRKRKKKKIICKHKGCFIHFVVFTRN